MKSVVCVTCIEGRNVNQFAHAVNCPYEGYTVIYAPMPSMPKPSLLSRIVTRLIDTLASLPDPYTYGMW